jgi:septal ring factor EnvC (AmiA/AmiB activator)
MEPTKPSLEDLIQKTREVDQLLEEQTERSKSLEEQVKEIEKENERLKAQSEAIRATLGKTSAEVDAELPELEARVQQAISTMNSEEMATLKHILENLPEPLRTKELQLFEKYSKPRNP